MTISLRTLLWLSACGGGAPEPSTPPEPAPAAAPDAKPAFSEEDPLGLGTPLAFTPPTTPIPPLDAPALLTAYATAYPERDVVHCPAGPASAIEGSIGTSFLPIDPWLPVARGILVQGGRLTAAVDGPEGHGLIYVDARPVARLMWWGARNKTGACSVEPLETVRIAGTIVGQAAGDASAARPRVFVRGCGPDQVFEVGEDGSFGFEAARWQRCRPLALAVDDAGFGSGPMVDLGYVERDVAEVRLESATKLLPHEEQQKRLDAARAKAEAARSTARESRETVEDPAAKAILELLYRQEDALLGMEAALVEKHRGSGRNDAWAALQ